MVLFAENTLQSNVGPSSFLQYQKLIQVTKIDETVLHCVEIYEPKT